MRQDAGSHALREPLTADKKGGGYLTDWAEQNLF